MANSNVVINVRSNLLQVAEHLRSIAGASKSAMASLDPFVKIAGNAISDASQKSMNGLQRLRNISSSIGKKMGDDFKAMFSAMGIAQGLKMGSIFGQSIKEAFQLSDQIRKLSSVFNIAESRFIGFQTKMVKGLGEIGLSADSASNALKGLSETQVRGEDTLVEYAKIAGQLASIFQQQGQEGAIAKGIAEVITARGGNPSNVKDAKKIAEDVRKTSSATGISPVEILAGMKKLFEDMNIDFKKSISTQGLMQLAVIQKVSGEGGTKFIQDYLSKSSIQREIPNARGLKNVFTEEGLDIPKFKKAMKSIFAVIPQDMQMAAQTLGVDEETAKGLIQLYKSLERVDEAQKKVQNDTKTLTQVYYQSMGAVEAFTASLNKFKASMSEQVSVVTNWVTDVLKKGFQASLSDLTKSFLPANMQKKVLAAEKALPDVFGKNFGSTLTTISAAFGSAALFGGALSNLGNLLKGKAAGLVEKKAAETILGEKAQPVYVVNADEIGSKASAGGTLGGTKRVLSGVEKAVAVAAVGIVAYESASAISDISKEYQPEFMNQSDIIIDRFLQKLTDYVWKPKIEPIVQTMMPGGNVRVGTPGFNPNTDQAYQANLKEGKNPSNQAQGKNGL